MQEADVKGEITPMGESQKCVGLIEAGHAAAVSELLFLRTLLIEFGCGVEAEANCPRTLGFTDG